MPQIALASIPSTNQIPGVFTEANLDPFAVATGVEQQKTLIVGQKLGTGSAAASEKITVASLASAQSLFGAGSMLHAMCEKFFLSNPGGSLQVYPLDDPNGATKASGTITISGAPNASGSLVVYIFGRRYQVDVTTSSTPSTIAAALAAAITGDAFAQVTAAASSGVVTVTHKHGGVIGNDDAIAHSFLDDEEVPNGLTVVLAQLNGGAGAVDLADLISILGEERINLLVMPYNSGSDLLGLDAKLEELWGAQSLNDLQAITAYKQSFNDHNTLVSGINYRNITAINAVGHYPKYCWAASLAGAVAKSASADPATPFQGLELIGLQASVNSQPLNSERQTLLQNGSTTYTILQNKIYLERVKLLRTSDANGSPLPAAASDLNPKLILSFIRYDFVVDYLRKYRRAKLADDGIRVPAGSNIVTPSLVKASVVTRYQFWQDTLGLVENLSVFRSNIVVERNAADRNRLDIVMPVDLINQVRVTGVNFSYII